ncbi:DUF6042 family protein [Streptomyces sp. NPDC003035]|uniref:DUF6042 family protein n=1 Tax=Streptomyces sp. NPDC003035 TaxID=3364676 RepID=UPI0036821C73
MSVDQDSTEHSDDGSLAMHTGWFATGWPKYLPQYQSMVLCMLFGTASVRGMSGTIDDVTQELFGGRLGSFFGRDGGDLDSPVMWQDPDELDYAETEEEKAEIRADAAAHQAKCEGLLRSAGLAVPTTVRELADTMVALGIATQQDGVWSMPEPLPRPEDILDLPEDDRAKLAEMRRIFELGPAENALIGHLRDDLNRPDELFTSLDRLATATDLTEDDARGALARLIEEGDARLERGKARAQVALDTLKSHERFHLVLDWAHFDEYRLTFTRG